MPYQSDDDPVVETLNSMVWGIIGLFAGILAALGIVAWQKATAAKLPDSLEGPFDNQLLNSLDVNSQQTKAILGIGLVASFGIGYLVVDHTRR